MRARTALILLDLFDAGKKELQARSENRSLLMNYPLLYVQGERDGVVPVSVGKAFYEFAQSSDKKFLSLPNFTHQPLVDKDWSFPLQEVVAWVAGHASSQS